MRPDIQARSSAPSVSRLPERWRRAPRRWGHPLHGLCSYFAMFPPQIPSVFIRWLTQPGARVYDPFSGRGTVPLEAVLEGRRAYGSDANPLAAALTAAKVRIPSRAAVDARLAELRELYEEASPISIEDVPADIRMLYSKSTLDQLVFLKYELSRSAAADRFITGMVLGMLHGNHSSRGATRSFSISMPNTFAMSPGYVRRYIREHQLKAPRVDVFKMLRTRAEKLGLPQKTVSAGRAWRGDATRRAPKWMREDRAQLVFTSPPYLETIKYGKYNWVRLWFLGHSSEGVDEHLMASSSLNRYLAFMNDTFAHLEDCVNADGYACLVIGDVRVRKSDSYINLAEEVWGNVAQPRGWHLHGIITDRLPSGQKVSRIWKNNPGQATKIDRLLLLSPSETNLPPLARLRWDTPVIEPAR